MNIFFVNPSEKWVIGQMANSKRDRYACRETQDRNICLPGTEATVGTLNYKF